MLSSLKKEKYNLKQFALDVKNAKVTENDVLRAGFTKKNGYFTSKKRTNKALAYVVLEYEKGVDGIYSVALAIKKFLDFRHVSNICILFSCDTIAKYEEVISNQSDVLFLHFNDTKEQNSIPENNVFLGSCNFIVSPYPKILQEKLIELKRIAQDCNLNCSESNEGLIGDDYFASLTELEVKLLDFSNKTAKFDRMNCVMSRVYVQELRLPVVCSEYYYDLFSFLPKKLGMIKYNGLGGNVLDKTNGIFVDVNVNTEKNIESLYFIIRTFSEDING